MIPPGTFQLEVRVARIRDAYARLTESGLTDEQAIEELETIHDEAKALMSKAGRILLDAATREPAGTLGGG